MYVTVALVQLFARSQMVATSARLPPRTALLPDDVAVHSFDFE